VLKVCRTPGPTACSKTKRCCACKVIRKEQNSMTVPQPSNLRSNANGSLLVVRYFSLLFLMYLHP